MKLAVVIYDLTCLCNTYSLYDESSCTRHTVCMTRAAALAIQSVRREQLHSPYSLYDESSCTRHTVCMTSASGAVDVWQVLQVLARCRASCPSQPTLGGHCTFDRPEALGYQGLTSLRCIWQYTGWHCTILHKSALHCMTLHLTALQCKTAGMHRRQSKYAFVNNRDYHYCGAIKVTNSAITKCVAQFKCAQTVVGHRFAGNGPNGLSYYYYYYY